jgi:enoyl-CoA hydratase/carnithine racemase
VQESGVLLKESPVSGVCVLRMNRPKVYNALNQELVVALRAEISRVWDAGVRVMVLTASEPGFCSGADLKQRKTMSPEERFAHNREINALANEIAALPLPTVAAINGVAMGGGCELALACDIRFASDAATIGLTEARIGAMPGAGGTQRLSRLVGTARALEMMYSGEPVSAARAAEIGLVNHVVGAAELESRVMSFCGQLASRSRDTARLLKRAVYVGIDLSLAEGLELEREAIVKVLASEDYQEGLAAFAERRVPNFS